MTPEELEKMNQDASAYSIKIFGSNNNGVIKAMCKEIFKEGRMSADSVIDEKNKRIAELEELSRKAHEESMQIFDAWAKKVDLAGRERDVALEKLDIAKSQLRFIAKQITPNEWGNAEGDEWDDVAASTAFEIIILEARKVLAKLEKEGK